MIPYTQSALAVAGARTGIAPANLLDVQTPSGDIYYWADRPVSTAAAITADGSIQTVNYSPWLLSVPKFSFHRSMQTDTGSFTVQNLSGDTLARDFERIARRSALEGSFFIYRNWQADIETAWLEFHGKLTVTRVGPSSVDLNAADIDATAQTDTPLDNYSESCQLIHGLKRCGSTQPQECLYSFATCQVVEHYSGLLVNFEKNYTDTVASVATQVINRRRKI